MQGMMPKEEVGICVRRQSSHQSVSCLTFADAETLLFGSGNSLFVWNVNATKETARFEFHQSAHLHGLEGPCAVSFRDGGGGWGEGGEGDGEILLAWGQRRVQIYFFGGKGTGRSVERASAYRVPLDILTADVEDWVLAAVWHDGRGRDGVGRGGSSEGLRLFVASGHSFVDELEVRSPCLSGGGSAGSVRHVRRFEPLKWSLLFSAALLISQKCGHGVTGTSGEGVDGSEGPWVMFAAGTATGRIELWRFNARENTEGLSTAAAKSRKQTRSGVIVSRLPAPLASLEAHRGAVFRVRFFFGGRLMASVGDDRKAVVYMRREGGRGYAALVTLVGHLSRIWDVTLTSPPPVSGSARAGVSGGDGERLQGSVEEKVGVLTAGEDAACCFFVVEIPATLPSREGVGSLIPIPRQSPLSVFRGHKGKGVHCVQALGKGTVGRGRVSESAHSAGSALAAEGGQGGSGIVDEAVGLVASGGEDGDVKIWRLAGLRGLGEKGGAKGEMTAEAGGGFSLKWKLKEEVEGLEEGMEGSGVSKDFVRSLCFVKDEFGLEGENKKDENWGKKLLVTSNEGRIFVLSKSKQRESGGVEGERVEAAPGSHEGSEEFGSRPLCRLLVHLSGYRLTCVDQRGGVLLVGTAEGFCCAVSLGEKRGSPFYWRVFAPELGRVARVFLFSLGRTVHSLGVGGECWGAAATNHLGHLWVGFLQSDSGNGWTCREWASGSLKIKKKNTRLCSFGAVPLDQNVQESTHVSAFLVVVGDEFGDVHAVRLPSLDSLGDGGSDRSLIHLGVARGVHGKESVNDIRVVPSQSLTAFEGDHQSPSRFLVRSCGNNGSLTEMECTPDVPTESRAGVGSREDGIFTTLRNQKIPKINQVFRLLSPSAALPEGTEGAEGGGAEASDDDDDDEEMGIPNEKDGRGDLDHSKNDHDVLLCFRATDLVLWDAASAMEALRLPCGGSKRPLDAVRGVRQERTGEDSCTAAVSLAFLAGDSVNWTEMVLGGGRGVGEERPSALSLRPGFHGKHIHCACFLADGLLCTGGEDNAVKLLQILPGKEGDTHTQGESGSPADQVQQGSLHLRAADSSEEHPAAVRAVWPVRLRGPEGEAEIVCSVGARTTLGLFTVCPKSGQRGEAPRVFLRKLALLSGGSFTFPPRSAEAFGQGEKEGQGRSYQFGDERLTSVTSLPPPLCVSDPTHEDCDMAQEDAELRGESWRDIMRAAVVAGSSAAKLTLCSVEGKNAGVSTGQSQQEASSFRLTSVQPRQTVQLPGACLCLASLSTQPPFSSVSSKESAGSHSLTVSLSRLRATLSGLVVAGTTQGRLCIFLLLWDEESERRAEEATEHSSKKRACVNSPPSSSSSSSSSIQSPATSLLSSPRLLLLQVHEAHNFGANCVALTDLSGLGEDRETERESTKTVRLASVLLVSGGDDQDIVILHLRVFALCSAGASGVSRESSFTGEGTGKGKGGSRETGGDRDILSQIVASRRLQLAHASAVRGLAIPSFPFLFSAGWDQRLRVWRLDCGALKKGQEDTGKDRAGEGEVTQIQISENIADKVLASPIADVSSLDAWDVKTADLNQSSKKSSQQKLFRVAIAGGQGGVEVVELSCRLAEA